MQEILHTARLVLRPPEAGDAARIVTLMNNWNVVRMLARPPFPFRDEDAQVFLTRAAGRTAAHNDAVYAITMGDDGLIGVISVAPHREGGSLGYWLGEPYWRQGIMTEAVGAVVAEFLEQPDNANLISGVFVGNDGSLAIQRKYGFEDIDIIEARCEARDAKVPQIVTRLTRERYEELGL